MVEYQGVVQNDTLTVVFIANGVRLQKSFDSLYLCNKFINKCKRSRDVTLVSYPQIRV